MWRTRRAAVSAYDRCPTATCSAPATGSTCTHGGAATLPINCVSWNQARAYCLWRGGDLPTESQWEYAARGTDGRSYPWGNDAPSSQLCWSGTTSRSGACAVGSYPAGIFGLGDMSGGVSEWTLDWHSAYTGNTSTYVMNPTGPSSGTFKAIRGGSWFDTTATGVRSANRTYRAPANQPASVGFRCARAAM
jgi:formylglycine-generating enzyme required for sulfatase activity